MTLSDLAGHLISLWRVTGWPPAYSQHDSSQHSAPPHHAVADVNELTDKPEISAASLQQPAALPPYQQDDGVAPESA